MVGGRVLVREARAIAARHIARHVGPGFVGAFLTGSATVRPEDAPLPSTSDVDVVVVVAGEPPPGAGKRLVHGVLVEVSFVAEDALAAAATDLGADTVSGHLDAVAERFAAAGRAATPDAPYAADLAPDARPVAIDGSRALVGAGDHREAVFRVVAVAARCQRVLGGDDAWFRRLVGDLTGLRSVDDVVARRDDVLTTIGSFPAGPVPYP